METVKEDVIRLSDHFGGCSYYSVHPIKISESRLNHRCAVQYLSSSVELVPAIWQWRWPLVCRTKNKHVNTNTNNQLALSPEHLSMSTWTSWLDLGRSWVWCRCPATETTGEEKGGDQKNQSAQDLWSGFILTVEFSLIWIPINTVIWTYSGPYSLDSVQ